MWPLTEEWSLTILSLLNSLFFLLHHLKYKIFCTLLFRIYLLYPIKFYKILPFSCDWSHESDRSHPSPFPTLFSFSFHAILNAKYSARSRSTWTGYLKKNLQFCVFQIFFLFASTSSLNLLITLYVVIPQELIAEKICRFYAKFSFQFPLKMLNLYNSSIRFRIS